MEQSDQGEGFVVRVRGLPWSATRDDIGNFFSPVAVMGGPQGVHFTFTRDGRPSGEAFIEFASLDELEAALRKHNGTMGRRYVEVFRSKKTEMDWVLQKSGQVGAKVDAVVRLRGLPYGCGKEDIEQFFSGLQIAANGITLTSDMEGRSSGEAFVEFTSAEEADKALGRHRQAMAHRYVEVFRSNSAELKLFKDGEARGGYGGSRHSPYERGRQGDYDPAFHNRYGSGYERRYRGGNRVGFGREDGLAPAMYSDQYYNTFGQYEMGYGQGYGIRRDVREMGMMERGGNRMGVTLNARSTTPHCVRMRGLPFSATEQNVLEFFAPLTPVAVHMEYDRSSRASGEATVDFATHEEASEAMGKNRQSVGHRYIELFLHSCATRPAPAGAQGAIPMGAGAPAGRVMANPAVPDQNMMAVSSYGMSGMTGQELVTAYPTSSMTMTVGSAMGGVPAVAPAGAPSPAAAMMVSSMSNMGQVMSSMAPSMVVASMAPSMALTGAPQMNMAGAMPRDGQAFSSF